MLGFVAEAETTDIVIDEKEIEFAMWVHRDDVAGLPERTSTFPVRFQLHATFWKIGAKAAYRRDQRHILMQNPEPTRIGNL